MSLDILAGSYHRLPVLRIEFDNCMARMNLEEQERRSSGISCG